MSSGELLLTSLVALLVFGPSKLPMLARHAGLAIRRYQHYKHKLSQAWLQHVRTEQLQENIRRAQTADASYQPVPETSSSHEQ